MAAASSRSVGIRKPYQIILAGVHDAGKTTIFNTLVTEFEDSYSFKSVNKGSRKMPSFHHKYMNESGEVELLLKDTAGMEKKGGTVAMTKSYFRQAVGVILVYDTSNLESLNKLISWVKMAEDTCEYAQHLVYALWGNEKGSYYSSVDNPVEDYHVRDLVAQLENTLAKPIQIEQQLICRMNGTDQTAVAGNYETLVRTLHRKMREIDQAMKEVSQRITLDSNKLEENPKPEGQDNEPSRGCWC